MKLALSSPLLFQARCPKGSWDYSKEEAQKTVLLCGLCARCYPSVPTILGCIGDCFSNGGHSKLPNAYKDPNLQSLSCDWPHYQEPCTWVNTPFNKPPISQWDLFTLMGPTE